MARSPGPDFPAQAGGPSRRPPLDYAAAASGGRRPAEIYVPCTDSDSASRSELRAHQLQCLRELLATLGQNRFYAPRLAAAGVDGELESLEQFVARMPFTTKDELVRDQDQHPPYGTNLSFPLAHYTRLHQTSSTTGRPLRWLDTNASWKWMCDTWRHVFDGAGVDADDRILFAFSFGPFIGFWLGFVAGQDLGSLCIPAGPTDSSTRLALMGANDVSVLCCTPTYAIRLGEVARAEGFDVASLPLRAVIVGGEPGGSVPATAGADRVPVERRARVRPLRHDGDRARHASSDATRTSTWCTWSSRRTWSRSSTRRRASRSTRRNDSSLGELVLTNLGRTGSPLLRYRSGDLVRPLAPDDGDQPFLRLDGGVRARADHMVVVRGVNLYPSAIDQIVRGIDGVAEYRVEIDRAGAMIELRLLVEPAPDCTDPGELCERLERALRTSFSLRIPVERVAQGSLPRFELKAKRWIEV